MPKRLLEVIPALGFLLVLAPSAHAILGAGDIVSDPATEANTAETAAALGTANATLVSNSSFRRHTLALEPSAGQVIRVFIRASANTSTRSTAS